MKTKKIAVFFGGFNNEREVSLNSGKNICLTLAQKYEVLPIEIGVNKSLNFVSLESLKKMENGFNLEKDFKLDILKKMSFEELKKSNELSVDFVFLALHGAWGEDGGVQSILDYYQIPYTGSSAKVNAICMDKLITQKLANSIDIKTPLTFQISFPINSGVSLPNNYPLFAKPNSGGSSNGNKLIRQEEDYNSLKGEYLIQEYISGREFTVGIIDSEALPVIEIIAENNFDYAAKYLSNSTKEIFPDESKLTKELQKQTLLITRELGCRGLTRSDFLVTLQGENQIYYLETNTIPGCTSSSLCPKMAKKLNYSMLEFLEKQFPK